MSTNWIETNLAEGTLSWDRVLLKLLSIVLQSALSAQAGDIAQSKYYQGNEYLSYRDVELTLAQGASSRVQDLAGKFTIRYRKGKKDMENLNNVAYVDPIPQNEVCVVKLLLIVALCSGNVYGTTIQEVLRHTALRYN